MRRDPDLKSVIVGDSRTWDPEIDSTDVDRAHDRARKLGARCDACPLYGHREGPVMGEIRARAPLLLIGEAPGAKEVDRGAPFRGPSGQEIEDALRRNNLDREQVSLTNALLCRPPKGKPLQSFLSSYRRRHPDAEDPLDCCAPRLETEIKRASPQGILTLGSVALKRVARTYGVAYGDRKDRSPGERGLLKLDKQRGHPFRLPKGPAGRPILIATYHPAHALRSAMWELGAIRTDLGRLWRIAVNQEGSYKLRLPDQMITWCPKLPAESRWSIEIPAWFRPTKDPEVFRSRAEKALAVLDRNTKAILTVDIETAGKEPTDPIRTINFHFEAEGEEWVLILPLLYRSGRVIDPCPGFAEWSRDIARRLIDAPGRRIAFQNGTFDTRHLLRENLLTSRSKGWLDTMPAHRASRFGENRHNLAAIQADLADRIGDLELHKDSVLHGGSDKEG